MKISILCVGRIKEKYWNDAIAEYTKRLSRYCSLQIREDTAAFRSGKFRMKPFRTMHRQPWRRRSSIRKENA